MHAKQGEIETKLKIDNCQNFFISHSDIFSNSDFTDKDTDLLYWF